MKPKVKKVLKIIGPVFGIAAGITTVVLTSGFIYNISTVSIGGSTAVMPLINEIANQLSYIDIVTSAGGSGAGISSIIEGSKEIGMASKKPQLEKWKVSDSEKYRIWEEKHVKTLTIAWDGIGIIYKPSMNNQVPLDLNEETISKIYAAFSGHKQLTLGDLLNDDDPTIVIPYARNGGGDVSGTTEAFLLESHLEYKNTEYWKCLGNTLQEKIINSIQSGNYGKNVRQTSEANSQAWTNVKNGPEGSMIYLSSGYILNNLKEIEDHGFKVATYKGKEMKAESISTGYNWFRPFNLIYSIDYIRQKPVIIKMLEDILFNSDPKIHERINQVIRSSGFQPLTNDQIKAMFNNQPIDHPQELLTDIKYSDISPKDQKWK